MVNFSTSAERRLGQLIAEQKETVGLNGGGRPMKETGAVAEPVFNDRPTLADIGVDKKLSAHSQKVAAIPEAEFEGIGKSALPSEKGTPTLAEIGVDYKLSAHSQKVAAIPEAEFGGRDRKFAEARPFGRAREGIRRKPLPERKRFPLWARARGNSFSPPTKSGDTKPKQTRPERQLGNFPNVISHNLHRRHLSESQRASVAAKLANMQAGDNQHSGGGANLPDLLGESKPAPVTVAQAADMLNVSERSVASARKVQEQGAPALVAAVDEGHPSGRRTRGEVSKLDTVKGKDGVSQPARKPILSAMLSRTTCTAVT